MRRIGRLLFNPALLHFLILLAIANLAANFAYWCRLISEREVVAVAQLCAGGFLIALAYTALFEREPEA